MGDDSKVKPVRAVVGALPLDRLAKESRSLVGAMMEKALSAMAEKAGSMTGRLTEYAENGSGKTGSAEETKPEEAKSDANDSGGQSHGLLDRAGEKAKKAVGGGRGKSSDKGGKSSGKGGQKTRVTNVVESIDIGAPIRIVYDQWTRFEDFPTFMKKVENVEQESEEQLKWTAQIFWSHRSWTADIVEQVPDERIVWRSEGEKGHVDGAVTFHELTPNLTRVIVVLEYHPKGFFEHVGNMWRAQGRRVRLELKHFGRHVVTHSVLHPDETEGWRGEIHDGEVAEGKEPAEEGEKSQDDARAAEEKPVESP
ncbi:SRPBCC family protein [Streptosporangium sp. KLBMP 9127]|nr:SRPBCC family protein [Streptosporangium sp. KLBMP 9127]